MKRILALTALIMALGSLPFGAFALGLGNIDLHSALGQKLDADIALVGANKESASALTISLASPEAYQRAQIDRSAILQSLKFQVVSDANGYHVHVTSSEPVREPFLTFLVVARWSSGQMLREYTVLLDPPNYAASGATAAAAAAPTVTQSAPAESAPQVLPATTNHPAPQPVEPAPAMSAVGGNYGPIRRGETLWGIARKLTSGSPADVDRMMIAVYRANPNAFSGNINRMKAGYVLRVPDANVVNAVSLRQAIAAIKQANQEFMTASSASSSATPSETAAKPAATAPETAPATQTPTVAKASDAGASGEAHLQLVAPGDNAGQANATPGAGQDSAQTAALKQQLEAARQDAADAATKNATLAGQVDNLKQQLQKTQRLLTVKDKQLTQIQNQVQALEAKQRAADNGSGSGSGVDRVIAFVTRPVFLIGLVIVIVLLIGGAVVRRQQRKAASGSGKPAQPVVAAMATDQNEDDADAAAEPAAVPADEVEMVPVAGDEASDPIAEADFHIDYGLYDQAADIVRAGIAADPGRGALKLKLFQIYFAAGDAAAFRGAAQEFASDWGADNPAEWGEVTTMGRQLAPNEPLFAAGFEEGGAASEPTPTEMPTEVATEVGLDTAMEFKAADEDVDEIVADPRDEALDLDINLDEPLAKDAQPETDAIEPPAQSYDGAIDFEPAADAPALEPASSTDATTEFGTGTEMDFSELEADLDPDSKPIETPRALLDTQTEFEDAIRELSEFVDTNFPNETADESQTVAFDEGPEAEPFVATQPVPADTPDDDVFADDDDVDEMDTKLDLARAYMDMGDPEGARGILEEVLEEGSAAHQEKARGLLDKVG